MISVFEVAVAADDVVARGTGLTWPPPYTAHESTTATTIQTSRSVEVNDYVIRNGLLRFNTATLTPAATVNNARLQVTSVDKNDDDARNFVAQYFNWSGSGSSDYTATAPTSGLAINTPLTAHPPPIVTYLDMVSAASGINTSSTTGLRTHISGSAPFGANQLTINSSSATLHLRPRLLVDHTYPATPTTAGTHTVRFQIQNGANDMEVSRYASATYPPTTGPTVFPNATGVWITKGMNAANTNYETSNVLLAWDTSSIPDAATINSATLRFWNYYMVNTNNRSIVGEYFNWSGTTADFTQNVGSTALNRSLSLFPTMTNSGQGRVWAAIPLTSVTGINKNGLTMMRLGISGTATPTGENIFRFYSYEETTTNTLVTPPAELEVTYTVPETGGNRALLGAVSN